MAADDGAAGAGGAEVEAGLSASDPKQLEKREAALALEKKQRDRDLRHLLSQVQFQRFFVRLLEDSRAFERSYDVSKRRLIDEGEKMAIMKIFHEIDQTQPDVIIRIMNVRAQKRQERL